MQMGTSKLAETVYKALIPEVNISQKAGVKTSLKVKDSIITLQIEAQSIARLRAILNSYLRWVSTIIDTIEEKTKPDQPNLKPNSIP